VVEELPSSSSLCPAGTRPDEDGFMGTLENRSFLGIGISNRSTFFENSLKRFLGDVFYLPLVVVSAYLLRRE